MNFIKNRNFKTDFKIKLLIAFVMVLLIVFMFPTGETIESEVNVGSIWIQDDLIASKTFEILKDPETYRKERQAAASKVLPVFIRDDYVIEASLDSLKRYNKFLQQKLSREEFFEHIPLSNSSAEIFYRLKRNPASFSNLQTRSFRSLLKLTEELIIRIYNRGLIDQQYNDISRDSITVRQGRYERIYPKTFYFDISSVSEFIESFLRANVGNDDKLISALTEYILYFLKPNINYSYDETQLAIQIAMDRVPRAIGIVNENERIVAKHDRITPEIKQKIDSYRIAKGEEITFPGKITQGIGKFLHIGIILLPFILYIYLFRKKIYNDNVRILLISIIFLFISFFAYLIYQLDLPVEAELLVPVAVASMLLTIIFDSRVGFYGTVVTSLIVAGLRGNDYIFAVINIVAGAIAAYTVRDIKNRNQIFRSFIFILFGYFLSIVAFGLERIDTLSTIGSSLIYAASNALISPVLTYGLIIFIEKIFSITTDLTLLELTDFNHPLLKELARKTPGTFNHSMIIGTMVESAAVEISANPILARVGAYYHDIGKLIEPTAFVENQSGSENIHDKLKPEESVKIIVEHVTKGIELAKEYKLPQEIIDFIPMHHGTIVLKYFFEKAKDLYGEANVNIDEFRYKGPKPNTKETALVMIADACESTIRAITEPTPIKIENVIDNIIEDRINDGQLDNSSLTFSDIKKIKESFKNILLGQHHKRIRYPNQDEMENNKKEG
ncbi:HD family phosphohydrolase [Melioribacter sp. OK-6-Me]|uniref:HD family phosphohydrolase n=1 Tax=unclassified Melioribacter TaxID=2627329 RepID=UPI003EDA8C0D